MLSADKYHVLLKRSSSVLILVAIGISLFTVWRYGMHKRETPSVPPANNATIMPAQNSITAEELSKVMQSTEPRTEPKDTPQVTVTARYRLAGTFFALDETATNELRKAIIDDLSVSNQYIVAEAQTLNDITVKQIFKDHILIDRNGKEEELWLTFNLQPAAQISAGKPIASEAGLTGTNLTSRFGEKLVGDNRWIFDRKLLLDYYSELRDNPDRLVAVFDSLKPIYDNDRKITGYRVGIEGEQEFFKAVGFKEGDVVRSVNSLQMTNRRRAEYFLAEFVKDRANAFVIDIERSGTKQKLIYQVR